VLRRLLALLYLLARLWLRPRLFDSRLRLRLTRCLRPLLTNALLRLWLRRCSALFLLHSLRSFNTHRLRRRSALFGLCSLRLRPHHFPFRLSSRRLGYSLSLRLLSLTLRALRFSLLFSLLLLKLLHLPPRIFVSAR
jgi:hypothetical protein